MAKKTVISIVDDDESVREATRNLMRAVGLESEAFPSAEDFLKSDCRDRTCCLVTDVRMPGMTGLELHERLVAAGVTIPTLLVSAYSDDNLRSSALKAGIKCCLTKPFCEKDLLAFIDSVVGVDESEEKDG